MSRKYSWSNAESQYFTPNKRKTNEECETVCTLTIMIFGMILILALLLLF